MVSEAIDTVSSYSLFAAQGADEIRRHLNQLTHIIDKNTRISQRQLRIDRFFCPKHFYSSFLFVQVLVILKNCFVEESD